MTDDIDTAVPHSARIWNHWLGGKENHPVDAEAGDAYSAVFPGIVAIARGSRAFLRRAVHHLVTEAGVRQFLDVGAGLPATDNTHEVAQRLAPAARVVTTGSFVAKSARLDLGDPHSTRDYRPKRVYAQSKLAQMLFGFELDRRLRAAGATALSVVTHPGGALDSLTPARPAVHARTAGDRLRGLPAGVLVQGKEAGAWPAVRAVLDPSVIGGQLLGPRVLGLRGRPGLEAVRGPLADAGAAARLWDLSQELTGVDPDFAPGPRGLRNG